MVDLMHALRHHRLERQEMSPVISNSAKKTGSLQRALVTLVKDFDFLIDYGLARSLVWR